MHLDELYITVKGYCIIYPADSHSGTFRSACAEKNDKVCIVVDEAFCLFPLCKCSGGFPKLL